MKKNDASSKNTSKDKNQELIDVQEQLDGLNPESMDAKENTDSSENSSHSLASTPSPLEGRINKLKAQFIYSSDSLDSTSESSPRETNLRTESTNSSALLTDFSNNLKRQFSLEKEDLDENLQKALNFEEGSEYIYDGKTFGLEEEDNEPDLEISEQRQSMAYATMDKISKFLPLGAANQVSDVYKSKGITYKSYDNFYQLEIDFPTNMDKIIKSVLSETGICDDFAYLGAYLLSRELYRAKEEKKEINWGPVYLVRLLNAGHTTLLLGAPDDPNCIVVDSWVKDPHPHLLDTYKYRDDILKGFNPNKNSESSDDEIYHMLGMNSSNAISIRKIDFEKEFESQEIKESLINKFLKKYEVEKYDLTKRKLSKEEIENLNEEKTRGLKENANPSFLWNQINSAPSSFLTLNDKEKKINQKTTQEANKFSKNARHRTFSGQKEILSPEKQIKIDSNSQITTQEVISQLPSPPKDKAISHQSLLAQRLRSSYKSKGQALQESSTNSGSSFNQKEKSKRNRHSSPSQ